VERKLSYPVVYRKTNGEYYIHFCLNGKRIRLSNGKKINVPLYPNDYPKNQRKRKADELASIVYDYLVKNNYSFAVSSKPFSLNHFDEVIKAKLTEPLSPKYISTLDSLYKLLREEYKLNGSIGIKFTDKLLKSYKNPTSFNTIRRHLNVLLNHLKESGFDVKPTGLKPLKQTEILHKPITNLNEILEDIRAYNHNLYLCALFTYCCLLRPHREVRLLRWKDFSDDLKYVSVDGSRVKSKRNRIVPVPEIIRSNLSVGQPDHFIFTNSPVEFNDDYFKTLWSRYKKQSKIIDREVTLYSFRHTGAIDLFKRTGSITKLQSAMGHSSIKVSLTYLRGLEIPELSEEDMPRI
jgi:integrase